MMSRRSNKAAAGDTVQDKLTAEQPTSTPLPSDSGKQHASGKLKLQIAILGPGRMGSMFAYHLAKAGHDLTLVARGARLEQLQRDKAVVTVSGDRAKVEVSNSLDPTTPWDLVLVTVTASQAGAVLPTLRASSAKTVMYMFTTFESFAPLRDAVGKDRFAFGFPKLPALLVDGKLKSTTISKFTPTIVTHKAWADVFNDAGIPSSVTSDMQSYTRSHFAATTPIFALCCAVKKRSGRGLTWAEARTYAQAQGEAFAVVRSLGHTIAPVQYAVMSRLPRVLVALLLWWLSRNLPADLQDLASQGADEARSLIDAMAAAAAPGGAKALLAIRP